jgi:glycosyltransferase involved in cell wall biosynthesis
MISPFDLVVNRLWGPTIRLHSLAKELIHRGHEVLLAGPPPFTGSRPAELDNVPLYYFRRPFHRYDYPSDGRARERMDHNLRRHIPGIVISRWLELLKLVKRRRIDVIYVNRAYLDTAYPAFATHLMTRVPIICDWDDLEGIHGFTTSFRQPLRIQIFETINELLFPRFSGAVVVASRYLASFTENIGVKAEQIHYSPSVADDLMFHQGVDGAAIRSRFGIDDRKVLLYCGNLSHGNGVKVENILYTLKNLLELDSSFFLLVVGDGDMLDKNGEKGILVQLAETLGITEHAVFTGGVPYKEVPQYIAAADICLALFPVNVITMCKSPLKVYEYMACGKPVIARDVGEISHCIEDGTTGLLVYSDNPSEYSDKIRDAFSREGFLETLGRNARHVIETRFSWKFSADRVIEACESCLTNKKRKIQDARQ